MTDLAATVAALRPGMRVRVTLRHRPGEVFEGQVRRPAVHHVAAEAFGRALILDVPAGYLVRRPDGTPGRWVATCEVLTPEPLDLDHLHRLVVAAIDADDECDDQEARIRPTRTGDVTHVAEAKERALDELHDYIRSVA